MTGDILPAVQALQSAWGFKDRYRQADRQADTSFIVQLSKRNTLE